MSNIVDIFIAERERLLRDALRVVKNPHQAEEIVQDAYFKVSMLPKTDNIKNHKSFCYRVVRNLAIDCYRRKKVEENIFSSDEISGLNQPHARTPESDVSNTQKMGLIVKIIQRFPFRTQRAFEMHYYKGMTQREIANNLGVSATLVNFMLKEANAELMSQQPLLAG